MRRNVLRLRRGDEMRRHIKRSSPISGSVGTEIPLRFLHDAADLLSVRMTPITGSQPLRSASTMVRMSGNCAVP